MRVGRKAREIDGRRAHSIAEAQQALIEARAEQLAERDEQLTQQAARSAELEAELKRRGE